MRLPKPLHQVVGIILDKQTFALAAHHNPEGDAVGSLLALYHALSALGKKCEAISTSGIPRKCSFLPGADKIRKRPKLPRHQVFIALDTDGKDRLGAPPKVIERAQVVINIDHHHTSDFFGDINWVDEKAAAVGEMVYRLIKALGVPVTPPIATCLYAAIATDTGTFRFQNTKPDVLKIAADLVSKGADPHLVAYRIFDERPVRALHLLARALLSVQLDQKTKVAWATLRQKDFDATCTTDEDTEGIINFVRGAQGVQVAVLFRELAHGIKVSLRSVNNFDVSQVAEKFGGGGHPAAAGCTLKMSLKKAQRAVLSEIRKRVTGSE